MAFSHPKTEPFPKSDVLREDARHSVSHVKTIRRQSTITWNPQTLSSPNQTYPDGPKWINLISTIAPGYTASEFLNLSANLLLGGWRCQPVRVCGTIKWAEVHKKLDTEFGTEVEPIGVAYLFGGLYSSANVILTKMLWSRHYYQVHFRDKETEAQRR